MPVIKIKSNIGNYNVLFGNIAAYLKDIEKRGLRKCYIIDENVWKIYNKKELNNINKDEAIILPISETKKNLNTVKWLYNTLIERSAKRNLTIISVGGGITQDITGFLASTLYRGVNWIFIPTTFLAQADSCIGSKTSLNYRNFKNLIGTFYPPSEVFIDPGFIYSQKTLDFYSGLGEVIKLHLMGGIDKTKDLLRAYPEIIAKDRKTLEKIIYNALTIKKAYIENDEFDRGKRNLLNYGHCFGHALETTSRFKIPHGIAVLFGMMLANIIACSRNLLKKDFKEFIFSKVFLPSACILPKKSWLQKEAVLGAMKKDKKRTGKDLALIMLMDGCRMMRVNDVSEKEAINALRQLEYCLNKDSLNKL